MQKTYAKCGNTARWNWCQTGESPTIFFLMLQQDGTFCTVFYYIIIFYCIFYCWNIFKNWFTMHGLISTTKKNLQENPCFNLHSKCLLLHQHKLQQNYWICIHCGSQTVWSKK
jgi:hypothetical protein